MYLRDLLRAVARRWYVAVAGVLLTLGLAFLASTFVPVTYTATSSMLLVPPRSTIGPRGNPYMNLGGLAPALDVLTTRILANPATQDLVAVNPDAVLTVGPDTTTAGPILLISATAPSASDAIALRDTLSAQVNPTLKSLQDQLAIPNLSRIGLSTLAVDPTPKREAKDQLRAVIAISALGMAATALAVALIDSALTRRAASGRKLRGGRPTRAARAEVRWSGTADQAIAAVSSDTIDAVATSDQPHSGRRIAAKQVDEVGAGGRTRS